MLSDKAMNVAAKAVAKAVVSSRKFRKAEYEAASASITAACAQDPTLYPEMGEMLGKIGNVSATSQDLARAGIVDHGDASAFARKVAEMVDVVAGEVQKEAVKMLAK